MLQVQGLQDDDEDGGDASGKQPGRVSKSASLPLDLEALLLTMSSFILHPAQGVEQCAHCGAQRLGRAFICIKCDRPWQTAAEGDDRGDQGGGRELSPSSPSSPPVRRGYRVPTHQQPAAGVSQEVAQAAHHDAASPGAAAAVHRAATDRAPLPHVADNEPLKLPQSQPQEAEEACPFCMGPCTCLVGRGGPLQRSPAHTGDPSSEEVPLLVDETQHAFYVRAGGTGSGGSSDDEATHIFREYSPEALDQVGLAPCSCHLLRPFPPLPPAFSLPTPPKPAPSAPSLNQPVAPPSGSDSRCQPHEHVPPSTVDTDRTRAASKKKDTPLPCTRLCLVPEP